MKFEMKFENMQEFTKEYEKLFPMYAIIFHMTYVIFFSSECSKVNFVYYYIIFGIIIFYMITYEIYNKENTMNTEDIIDLIIKITEYITFTQMRGKPVKCLKGWSKGIVIIMWIISNTIIIIRIMQKMYNKNKKNIEREKKRKEIKRRYFKKELLNDEEELKNITIN